MENSVAPKEIPLSDELLSSLLNDDGSEDSDGDINSFLNEFEELVGNDEEIQEVLQILNRPTPSLTLFSSHKLDVNSNIVLGVADVSSNVDDDIQIIKERLENNNLTVETKPVVAENLPNRSAPETSLSQLHDIDPVRSPYSKFSQQSDFDLQNFGINVSSSSSSVQIELSSSNLQDEGGVSASCSPDKKPLSATPSINLAIDTKFDEQFLEATSATSDVFAGLDNFNFILDSCEAKFKTDFDENLNLLGASSVEVRSPSPFTEELLLGDSTDNLSKTIKTPETCLPITSDCSFEGKAENNSALPSGLDYVTLPSTEALVIPLPSPPPPPLEPLVEQETATVFTSSIVPVGGKALEKRPLTDLVSLTSADPLPETAKSVDVVIEADDKVCPSSVIENNVKSSVSSDVFVFGQGRSQTSTLASAIVCPNNGANSSTGSSKNQAIPSWAVPWVSSDAAENDDNNDPKWEILQKLQTDDERYRIVREKWRQSEIPDPRLDLTCNNYRRNRSQAFSVSGLQMQCRKRIRSPDKVEDNAQPNKRRRMLSCTDLFDNRIKDLKRQLGEENVALQAQYQKELSNLSIQQQEEQFKFYYSSTPPPPHILSRQMMDLQYYQEKQVDDLKCKFENKLDEITYDTSRNIDLLYKASKEVLAFNRFYTNLKYANDDHCKITEEEYNQFMQTEKMLDYYDEVYGN